MRPTIAITPADWEPGDEKLLRDAANRSRKAYYEDNAKRLERMAENAAAGTERAVETTSDARILRDAAKLFAETDAASAGRLDELARLIEEALARAGVPKAGTN